MPCNDSRGSGARGPGSTTGAIMGVSRPLTIMGTRTEESRQADGLQLLPASLYHATSDCLWDPWLLPLYHQLSNAHLTLGRPLPAAFILGPWIQFPVYLICLCSETAFTSRFDFSSFLFLIWVTCFETLLCLNSFLNPWGQGLEPWGLGLGWGYWAWLWNGVNGNLTDCVWGKIENENSTESTHRKGLI